MTKSLKSHRCLNCPGDLTRTTDGACSVPLSFERGEGPGKQIGGSSNAVFALALQGGMETAGLTGNSIELTASTSR